jgi:hypothetical protein
MDKRKFVRNAILLFALAIFIWLIFFQSYHYYLVASIALLFLPTLMLGNIIYKNELELAAFKSKYDLYKTTKATPINLSTPLFIVISALGLIATGNFQVLNYSVFLTLAFIAFCMLTFLVKLCFRKNGSIDEIAGLMIFYSLFLVLHLNQLGPISKEIYMKGAITDKFRQIKGLGYTFVIGENLMENRVGVSKLIYEKHKLGMEVCAKNVTGWLGITTRTLIECSTSLTTHSSGTPNGAP